MASRKLISSDLRSFIWNAKANYHRQEKILSQSMLVFPVFEEVFVILYWASPSRINISICNYLAPIAFLYLLYFYTVIKILYGYY